MPKTYLDGMSLVQAIPEAVEIVRDSVDVDIADVIEDGFKFKDDRIKMLLEDNTRLRKSMREMLQSE